MEQGRIGTRGAAKCGYIEALGAHCGSSIYLVCIRFYAERSAVVFFNVEIYCVITTALWFKFSVFDIVEFFSFYSVTMSVTFFLKWRFIV